MNERTRVRVEQVRIGELEEFAAAALAGEGGLPPITPQRARAQARNPVADPGDIVLFAAYCGQRLVGYLGTLPGWLRRGDRLSKVNWGSTWYLHPDFRKTSAGLLLGRNFRKFLPDPVFTDLSPTAWKLISFLRGTELGSYRYYRLKMKKFPGPLKNFGYKLLTPSPPSDLIIRKTDQVREGPGPFPGSSPAAAEFYRGPKVVNWMLKYPWVVEPGRSGITELDYLFTHQRRFFRMTAFEVYAGGGRDYRGYFAISLSSTGGERTMKILDYHFPDPADLQSLLSLALRQAKKHRADTVNIPGELLEDAGRAPLLRRLARPHDRPYLKYLSTAQTPLSLAAREIRLAYPDGDTAFT